MWLIKYEIMSGSKFLIHSLPNIYTSQFTLLNSSVHFKTHGITVFSTEWFSRHGYFSATFVPSFPALCVNVGAVPCPPLDYPLFLRLERTNCQPGELFKITSKCVMKRKYKPYKNTEYYCGSAHSWRLLMYFHEIVLCRITLQTHASHNEVAKLNEALHPSSESNKQRNVSAWK
jgi:hypothetical protein